MYKTVHKASDARIPMGTSRLGRDCLLRMRRDRIETDIREENECRSTHQARKSVWNKRTATILIQRLERVLNPESAEQPPFLQLVRQLADLFFLHVGETGGDRRMVIEKLRTGCRDREIPGRDLAFDIGMPIDVVDRVGSVAAFDGDLGPISGVDVPNAERDDEQNHDDFDEDQCRIDRRAFADADDENDRGQGHDDDREKIAIGLRHELVTHFMGEGIRKKLG